VSLHQQPRGPESRGVKVWGTQEENWATGGGTDEEERDKWRSGQKEAKEGMIQGGRDLVSAKRGRRAG